MEESINERVKRILEHLTISENKFSAAIGIRQSVINSMFKRGTEPSAKIIKAIINAYPDISLDWLITGEGNMLNHFDVNKTGLPKKMKGYEQHLKDNPINIVEEARDVVYNKIEAGQNETRPRIPYTAAAGSLTSAVEGVMAEQCEQIPRIVAFPDYDFTIVIKGNSMEPKYEGGDEVACKRIDNTSFIQWGKVHVLDTAQGIIIKRVYEDGDNIRCASYNPEYPDFSISKDEIYSMSLVVGLLRL